MIEFCSDDLENSQELPEQFSIVGVGAQYIVGMLTGPENEHLTSWGDDEPASRVLKIPLPRSHVSLAVEGMNIASADRNAKIDGLIRSRQLHAALITLVSLCDDDLYDLTGRPRQTISPDLVYEPSQILPIVLYDEEDSNICCTAFYPSYSQDYSPSMTPILSSDPKDPSGAHVKRLIDGYAQVQRQLIARGLFDDIFKLDNYGYTPNGITIHDFSELRLDKCALDDTIRTRKWEQITENKEYTQLTPNMQDYFNDRMSRALHPSVVDTWSTHTFAAIPRLVLPDIIPAKYIEKIMDQL